MTFTAIILKAAKTIGVNGSLLLSICTTESHLRNVVVPHDGGSPSYGICQVKLATAHMLGYKGDAKGLMDPKTNAEWAARYLRYQLERYDHSWCKATAAYNAGRFNESEILPGKPRNLRYVNKVRAILENDLQDRISCDTMVVME